MFVGTKSEEEQYTHTHKIKHSTLIKNIDELIMVVMKEKSNFTRKKDDEEITRVCFESTHYHFNRNFKGENRVNISIKKHTSFTSKFQFLYLTPRNIN